MLQWSWFSVTSSSSYPKIPWKDTCSASYITSTFSNVLASMLITSLKWILLLVTFQNFAKKHWRWQLFISEHRQNVDRVLSWRRIHVNTFWWKQRMAELIDWSLGHYSDILLRNSLVVSSWRRQFDNFENLPELFY